MDSGSNRFWISERSYFFRKALRIFLPLFFLLALMIGAFLFFTSAPQIFPETTDFITGETIQPDVFWKEDGLNAPGCVAYAASVRAFSVRSVF